MDKDCHKTKRLGFLSRIYYFKTRNYYFTVPNGSRTIRTTLIYDGTAGDRRSKDAQTVSTRQGRKSKNGNKKMNKVLKKIEEYKEGYIDFPLFLALDEILRLKYEIEELATLQEAIKSYLLDYMDDKGEKEVKYEDFTFALVAGRKQYECDNEEYLEADKIAKSLKKQYQTLKGYTKPYLRIT